MKKILVFVLAMTMMLSLAACGGNNADNGSSDAANKIEVASAEELLNKVWETYAEDEKFFAMGGDFANPVDNAAGKFDLADAESVTATLYLPADQIANVDDAASLVHAMNANTFTGAAFHVADAANIEAVTGVLKDAIMNAQWMCGFPDKLVIFTVNGEYIVSAFGNAEIMDNFKTKAAEVYGDAAALVVEENLQ